MQLPLVLLSVSAFLCSFVHSKRCQQWSSSGICKCNVCNSFDCIHDTSLNKDVASELASASSYRCLEADTFFYRETFDKPPAPRCLRNGDIRGLKGFLLAKGFSHAKNKTKTTVILHSVCFQGQGVPLPPNSGLPNCRRVGRDREVL